MQLSICEVNYCDFVVWTLAGMENISVDRSEAFFSEVQPTLHAFFKNWILPELLTRKLQNPVRADLGTGSTTINKAGSSETLNGSVLYCYCQQPEDEQQMIGGDSDNSTTNGFILSAWD